MTLQGGDTEYGDGDEITVVYDDSTDAVGGEAVKITGRASTNDHVKVELTAGGNNSDGVIRDGATQGDAVTMVMHGIVWVRVVDADNVSAGDTVGEDTAGGIFGNTQSDYTVIEGERTDSESGNKIALIRYEN